MAHQTDHDTHPSRGMEPVIFIPLMCLSLIFFLRCIYRLIDGILCHRRLRCALQDPAQSRFVQPNLLKAFLNRHIIHAPLFRHRHNREFRSLGRGLHFGTLPTRIEAVFLCSYVLLNAAFCVVWIRWPNGLISCLNDLRDTSGTLAVGNLVPLVIIAGRNNPLIPLLGISFDTFNLVHRWIGRIILAEAILHATAVLLGVGFESKL
jgi:hypothetical protein